MSLLMDALKKAEQEKKEAAKRLKEAQEKSGEHIKLQTDEQAALTTPSDKSAAPEKITPAPADTSKTEGKKSSPELSLSPLNEVRHEKGPEPELSITNPGDEKKGSASLLLQDATIEHDELSDESDENYLDDEIKPAAGHDKTYALATDLSLDEDSVAPFDDTADNTVKEKLTETLSGSRSFKSVISAAELARDIGGITREAPTPVAAQTVFSAVGGVSGKRKVMEWVMFLGLFALIISAAGAFYYLKITPLTPEVSSPLVAHGVEVDATPAFIVPLPLEETPATHAAAGPDAAIITESPSDQIDAPVPAEIAETGSEQIAPAMPEQVESKPAARAAELSAQSMADEDYVLPAKIQVDETAIAISRTKSADKKDELINTAYSEYNRGNYVVAEAAYQGVLDTMPENRDALLGMAAIAWRKGNVQAAYEYYLRVMKLYPRDVVAATGIMSLQGHTDPVKNESLIKLMLRDQPETAFLHFASGNNYASQSRWPEAQQAFFEAFRLQSDNPDYAYNLAVSLDQIGQARAAMEYYNKALDLADTTQVSFNTANVLARVNDLSQIPK